MQRQDPLTKETFEPKRTNQRFASRKNQIRFNNDIAAIKRKAIASIVRVLDKNRNILKRSLGDKNEIILSRDFLLGAGFNFSYMTHSIKIGETIYTCIYDYCYTRLEDNRYRIIRNANNN